MVCPASLVGLFGQLLTCLLDTSLDGCHLEVISIGSGFHVAKNSHLVTWGLDTTPIDDFCHCDVERWSLGGVIFLHCTWQACRDGLDAYSWGHLDLSKLACRTRKVFP